MARVTHVKRAQQRYHTKPVLGEDGKPLRTPVMRRNGEQRVTKRGQAVTMAVTERDLTRPKPLLTCDFCHQEIALGTPYKHITPKSGPYGGHQRNRHGDCPTWQVWEYSSSLDAQIAEVEHNADLAAQSAETEDDVTSLLSEAAEGIREIASAKEEGADNIESGFGHSTSQSDELRATADSLNSWADDIEATEVPELPEVTDCEECDGTGQVEVAVEGSDVPNEEACEACNGAGIPEEPTDEQMDEWRGEVADAVSSALGERPF